MSSDHSGGTGQGVGHGPMVASHLVGSELKASQLPDSSHVMPSKLPEPTHADMSNAMLIQGESRCGLGKGLGDKNKGIELKTPGILDGNISDAVASVLTNGLRVAPNLLSGTTNLVKMPESTIPSPSPAFGEGIKGHNFNVGPAGG